MSRPKVVVWKLDTTPDWLQPRLDRLFEAGERVALCFEADMDMEGGYRPEALVVTDKRMFVMRQGAEEPVRELPLTDVALVRVKWLMGNGLLVVTTWDENLEILRFSPTLAQSVAEMHDALQDFLMTRLALEDPDEQEDKIEHVEPEEASADNAEQARRCPNCGQLLPRDRDICRACLSNRTVLARMLGYLRPYKKLVAVSLLLTLVGAGIAAAIPRMSRTLVDGAIGQSNMSLLAKLVVALAVMLMLRAALAAVRKLVVARLAQNVVYDLRQKVYSHLQDLSLDFFDRQSTGRLISRVVTDTARLQRFAVGHAQRFIVDVFMLVIVLIWMLRFSVPLTLLLWLPLPLFFWLVRWYRRNVHKVLRKAYRLRGAMSGHLADTIPGIETVKAFAQEPRAIHDFGRLSDGFRTERIRATSLSAQFVAGFMVLTQIGTVLVYWFGGRGTIQGSGFTVGQLVMFIGWLSIMYAPVRRFARITEQFERAATSAERVFDVLDSEVVVDHNEDGPKLEKIEEGIEFDNVTFGYESGTTVLRDISFSVKPGETVGIVGPSGSGKSTLMKLLCRFYDATRGRILIDGDDLADLNLASFRSQLAVVGQSPILFRQSILENIRYGRPKASRADAIRAARIANAHEFIMQFPEAYDTDAREQGTRFSGGERQRICIARAVLKDPELLILDEATSSVDTKNEKLIQEALDKLTTNRTTFIIAHRLSTLRNADKIVMLQEGRLLAVGTHDELMTTCDDYRELVESQEQLGSEAPLDA